MENQEAKSYNLPYHGGPSYKNPLAFSQPGRTNPDPFVMKHRGIYYCYSSDRDGVNVSLSKDLVHWEYKGYAITEPGRQEYWAPCIYYYNGLFYLYYSTAPAGDFDCHLEELRVATSLDPLTGFQLERVLLEPFSIDAHVVRDCDGTFYLFYSPNAYLGTDEDAAGTVILVDKLLDPITPEGCPKEVVLPSLEEEIYEKNRFGDGRDWHTIEGAFYLTRNEKAYVLYSANAFVHENYFIGYSVAEKSGSIDQLCWKKHPDEGGWDPLVCRNIAVEGTGHNSVVKAPNLVDDWIVYHGRNCSDPLIEGKEQRQMRIDPLFFHDGQLMTNAPSYLPQRAPRGPLYQDVFAALDSSLWEQVKGTFQVEDQSIRNTSTEGVSLLRLRNPVENYVMEIDLAAKPTHMGARYGVMLWYEDDHNYLELRLDTGKKHGFYFLCNNGLISMPEDFPLPRDFNPHAFHTLFVTRRFHRFDLSLDQVALPSCTAYVPYGGVALVARYTIARFSGFSLTESFALYGDTLRYFSSLYAAQGAPGRLEENALYSCSPLPTVFGALRPFTGNFTLEISFSLLRQDGSLQVDLGGGLLFHASEKGCTIIIPGESAIPLGQVGNGSTLHLCYENQKLLVLIKGQSISLKLPPETTCLEELILYRGKIKEFQYTRT